MIITLNKITSAKSIKRHEFLKKKGCVHYEVGTEILHICYMIFVIGLCHSSGNYLPDMILQQSCRICCGTVAGAGSTLVTRFSSVNVIPLMLHNHLNLNTKLIGRKIGRSVRSLKEKFFPISWRSAKETTFILIVFQKSSFSSY